MESCVVVAESEYAVSHATWELFRVKRIVLGSRWSRSHGNSSMVLD